MCSAGGEAVLTTVPEFVVLAPDGKRGTVKSKEATLTALEQQASSITGQASTSADYQGAIVNVASQAALVCLPHQSAYSAIKGAALPIAHSFLS